VVALRRRAVVCWSEADRQYQHVTAAVTVAEVLNLVASFGLAAVGLVYLAATAPPSPELRTVQLGVTAAIGGLGGLFAVVWFRRTTVERTVAGVAFLLRLTLGRVSEHVRRATDRTAIQAGVDRYYETFEKVRRDRRRVALAGLGAVVILYRVATYWFMVLIGGLGSAYRVATVGSGSLSTRP